jgi:hypothetical protein
MIPIAASGPMTAPAMRPAWLLETFPDGATGDELLLGNTDINPLAADESKVTVPLGKSDPSEFRNGVGDKEEVLISLKMCQIRPVILIVTHEGLSGEPTTELSG